MGLIVARGAVANDLPLIALMRADLKPYEVVNLAELETEADLHRDDVGDRGVRGGGLKLNVDRPDPSLARVEPILLLQQIEDLVVTERYLNRCHDGDASPQ